MGVTNYLLTGKALQVERDMTSSPDQKRRHLQIFYSYPVLLTRNYLQKNMSRPGRGSCVEKQILKKGASEFGHRVGTGPSGKQQVARQEATHPQKRVHCLSTRHQSLE